MWCEQNRNKEQPAGVRTEEQISEASPAQHVPDYPALLAREQHRHHIEKARRMRISHWLGA